MDIWVLGIINEMKDILDQIGVSPKILILVYFLGFISKEIFNSIKTNRIKAAQDISAELIKELNDQLHFFYLPIIERLKITKELFELTQNIGEPYDNDKLKIKSDDPKALREIIVNKLFIPFNKEIESIILNNLHLKHPDDKTNYFELVQHYRIWNALEESKSENLIESYDASNILKFPMEEADNCNTMCSVLHTRRNSLREKILSYKEIKNIFNYK